MDWKGKPEKIISGGQTGVDRAALQAALKLEIEVGGWCPPGRASEDGWIPSQYPLKETPREKSESAPDIPRSLRTEWNVRDADATLIFEPKDMQIEDQGTVWTKTCCLKMNKPVLLCDPFDSDCKRKIEDWLDIINPIVLNVAGPSENVVPGIFATTYETLIEVF
ncbi:putative molybdenum carrier protein [Fulvivirgaceae bacterium BMA10]|uniref:Molybdenum carrier protein n=1 Tax=Splendidivirga corallicola TaxID=3051826 RepID=A0ABT8KPQ5_9BACT|nr:putative molybdenum carrier protein [Fulvivirgaceae bacterium BMA10]